jgi:hypothetical protein
MPASPRNNALPSAPALYKKTMTWGIPALFLIVLGLGNPIEI